MAVEGGMKCVKFLVFIFNFIFWVSAGRGGRRCAFTRRDPPPPPLPLPSLGTPIAPSGDPGLRVGVGGEGRAGPSVGSGVNWAEFLGGPRVGFGGGGRALL